MLSTLLISVALAAPAAAMQSTDVEPVKLIFDTDMGNDVDDALALGVIHALQSRRECELLAVTLSKDNLFAVQYSALVNSFYGRPQIPLGRVRGGKTPEDGMFVRQVVEAAASAKHSGSGADAQDATSLLRRTLAAQPDGSVVFVVVGFSTNIARLLESKPDEHSPLDGRALVAKKARLLAMMAGRFGADRPKEFQEYNVQVDVPSAAKVFAEWPTPIVISGFEIGLAIEYPAVSIESDFNYVPHHPLKEAYIRYQKMPYDRPTWDLTAVLYAVRPDRGYFGLSQPGKLSVGDMGCAVLSPANSGTHRCLTVTPEQIARVREALVLLASEPPAEISRGGH